VNYSTAKLFRQKHTGNARAGSRRSPLRRGGGITFGPHPRSFRQEMPKKMRRLALRCMLSTKVADGELKIVEGLDFKKPSTKEMVSILTALDVKSPVLVVTDTAIENVVKSAHNLKDTKTTPAGLLNVVDLLSHKLLLMTEAAVRKAEELWGEKAAQEVSSEPV